MIPNLYDDWGDVYVDEDNVHFRRRGPRGGMKFICTFSIVKGLGVFGNPPAIADFPLSPESIQKKIIDAIKKLETP